MPTTITNAWSRKTKRLIEVQRSIGLLVGSSAGTRICQWLRMPVSIDSLLRSMRRYEPPRSATPRVLGVDDWAKRRGRTYGTILVDLESHHPVELLPDREASTLKCWLQDHPGVQIISRDRAGAYAEGAKQGAPNAIQVADRWHLLKNLSDALSRCLEHHRRQLKSLSPGMPNQPIMSTQASQVHHEVTPLVVEPAPASSGMKATVQQLKREARYTRYTEVRQAYVQGLTISALARLTGLDRKTVRKYAHATEFPEQAPRSRGRLGSKLDPFKAYLMQRWQEGCHTGRILWRELQQTGYVGGFTLVNDFLRQLRRSQGIPPRTRMVVASETIPLTPCPVTPRSLAAAIVAQPEKLKADQRHWLEQAKLLTPELQTIIHLGQTFAALVRNRQPTGLDPWLEQVAQSNISGLRGFARGLRRDYAAVQAALSHAYSNGQTEGQVNRLKFIKRQGYGRADFDLLRLRTLFAAQFG